MRTGTATIVAAVWLALGGAAQGSFQRGTLKIDVRSPRGEVLEATVMVRPQAGGEAKPVARAGQVYVAEGLVDGDWVVEVSGAQPQLVRVSGRQLLGVVAIVGEGKRGRREKPFTVGPDEVTCDGEEGVVVEAVAFAHDQLAAGRLEVRESGRKKAGPLVCSATIAGGGATLRLAPGDYTISARFVGGGHAQTPYRLVEGRAAPPLVLRGK